MNYMNQIDIWNRADCDVVCFCVCLCVSDMTTDVTLVQVHWALCGDTPKLRDGELGEGDHLRPLKV